MTQRLAHELIDRFNALDAHGLGALLTEQATHTAPGSKFGADIAGREALVAYFRDRVFPNFQSIRFVIERCYFDAAANVELAEWHGDFLTRAGVPYSNRGALVLELEDGRIARMREYFDTERSKQAMSGNASASH